MCAILSKATTKDTKAHTQGKNSEIQTFLINFVTLVVMVFPVYPETELTSVVTSH